MIRFVRILTVARADIDQIFDWIGKRSLRGAATWYDALFDSIQRIAENPEGYSTIPEALPRWNRRIHQALFKTPKGRRYRVVFEWSETTIYILRVRGPGQPPLRKMDLKRL